MNFRKIIDIEQLVLDIETPFLVSTGLLGNNFVTLSQISFRFTMDFEVPL